MSGFLKTIERALREWRYLMIRRGYSRATLSLRHRNELPYLLNACGLCGVGVEIGVKEGKHSEYLLSHWPGEKLISIDPWAPADAKEYRDNANVDDQAHEAYYQETVERLACFGDRSEIRREYSVEAAKKFKPASCDFIYVDARHDYESVVEDFETWLPILRSGGLFAGHDYLDGIIENTDFGVMRAVREMAARHDLEPVCQTLEKDYPSWYLFNS